MAANLTSETSNASASKFKIVFLGDQSVGKTSIIQRFIYDAFDEAYMATIGIDFLSKTLYVEDKIVRLQLWDTAGQERFKSLIPSYIKDSSVAVVVFDLTNPASFESVRKWIEDARNLRGEDVIIYLVGNKCDDSGRRKLDHSDCSALSKSMNIPYIETSAKEGVNIKTLFNDIAQKLLGGPNLIEKPEDASNVELHKPKEDPKGESEGAPAQQKKAGCC